MIVTGLIPNIVIAAMVCRGACREDISTVHPERVPVYPAIARAVRNGNHRTGRGGMPGESFIPVEREDGDTARLFADDHPARN